MMATAPVMFAGVAGCFAAGTELALLSGAGDEHYSKQAGPKSPAPRYLFLAAEVLGEGR